MANTGTFAVAAAIGLRGDFEVTTLRAIAKRTKDGPQARRLLALASIDDGATRSEAAKIGGVGLQIVRDWVLRFNAHGPDGLTDRKAPGQPSRLKDERRAALARMIEEGPTPAIHGVVRWRIVDLCQWIFYPIPLIETYGALLGAKRRRAYARDKLIAMSRDQQNMV